MVLVERIRRFLSKIKSCAGYTLIEAATVVGITSIIAVTTIPIASEKIEDSKIGTAAGTTVGMATAIVKFVGDAGIFPIAKDTTIGRTSFKNGHLQPPVTIDGQVETFKIKVLRSGVGKKEDARIGDSDIILDPDLESGNPNLNLWRPADPEDTSNLNRHLVTDDVGYSQGFIIWLGPYTPSIDQDPWGRNYLVYVNALNFENFRAIEASGDTFVAQVDGKRVYGWVISAGPNEMLETPPTNSIIRGDDIGTLLVMPAIAPGTSTKL